MKAKERIEEVMNHRAVREFMRFCIVGAVATAIDAGVFYFVRQFTVYQFALVSGFVVSLAANYFLTTLWTFKKKPTAKNAVGIVAAHLFSLFVVRMGLMYCLVGVMQMDDRLAYLPALLVSISTNFILVRFVARRW